MGRFEVFSVLRFGLPEGLIDDRVKTMRAVLFASAEPGKRAVMLPVAQAYIPVRLPAEQMFPFQAGFPDKEPAALRQLCVIGFAAEIQKSIMAIGIVSAETGIKQIGRREEKVHAGEGIRGRGEGQERRRDLSRTVQEWQAVINHAEFRIGVHLADLQAQLVSE